MLSSNSLRSLLVFLSDVAAATAAWLCAYWLRFSFAIPNEYLPGMWMSLALVVPVQAIVFRAFGLYRGIWIFASLPDLLRIARAIGFAALVAPLLVMLFLGLGAAVPRSVFVLQPALLLLLMGGSRAAYRGWREHRLYGALLGQGKPVLVLGAGSAAANLVRELSRSTDWRVVGLLDDDPAKRGREVRGQRVLGPIEELSRWAQHLRVRHAVIALQSSSHSARARAATICVRAGVKAMTVPTVADLISGKLTVSKMRQVEVEDLLGRDTVWIDTGAVADYLTSKTVMVTGAGGSIGAELCRQIAGFRPARLIFYEQNEFALYRLLEEFQQHFPGVPVTAAAGDVKDGLRLRDVLQRHAPSVVFHAAAYKHVPLMEDENAWEAVRNNVLGTYEAASACVAAGVSKFVLVSTDKAVNPVNVMGATKRLAEMVCQFLEASPGATRFEMVRFGNVLASTGSVIPKFHEQIARGGPVTVTHPDITRYFMSIPEAAQLVLQAAGMGQGGEIFVMDMGEPIRIVDLARDMIRLSGLEESDIEIVFTGLRPGEKLYEEILADDEQTRPTHHPKLRVARPQDAGIATLDALLRWLKQPRVPGVAEVRRELRRWVPEYRPASQVDLRAIEGGRPRGEAAEQRPPLIATTER